MQQRVLALYAHPDDAEIWAGGTLLVHRKLGDHTAVCLLTHKDTHRAQEAHAGIALLGATLYQHSLPDRSLHVTDTAINLVADVLKEERPHIILTHWQDDCHPDHTAVWEIVRSAILTARVTSTVAALYWSDTYNGRGLQKLFKPDCYVDITPVWETKLAAIRLHQSQTPEHYVTMIERQCSMHGAASGVPYAEGFIRVPFFGRVRRARASLRDDL